MREILDSWIAEFASLAWGLPLLILLIGGGLYFLILSKGLVYWYLRFTVQLLRSPRAVSEKGQINSFQALSTALSSTIGMGNISGVAVAIAIGGPGAIFWMWVSGLLGMTTKFFTGTLSLLYRGKDSNGDIQGGPMYFITEGLGKKWKPLAIFFSLAGLIGALPVFNVNQLTQAIRDILLKPNQLYTEQTSEWIIGFVLLAVTSVVILGGIKRIGATAARLVPSMVVLYFFSVLIILFIHIDQVPYYFQLILTDAFSANHFKEDSFLGGAVGGLILLGIRRGAFSNEAGIGTAPMAHGASNNPEPIQEGFIAMIGPLVDTLIVCTLTAFAILVTGAWQTSESNGVTLTSDAFQEAIPYGGQYLLLMCIAVFSISSLFSFSYYGTKCTSFLFGAHRSHYYNYFYLISILMGAVTSRDMMINLIDGFYALMAIPTMIAAVLLAPKVMEAFEIYRKST